MQNTAFLGMMGFSGDEIVALAVMMIPIVAIVSGIGMGAWAVYLSYRKRKEMFTLYHQERMAAIEKGIQLPPLPEQFFSDDTAKPRGRSPHAKLLAGLILTFLGMAVFIAMLFTDLGAISLWALTLVAVGLAFLIFYFAVDRKQAALMDAPRETANEQKL